MIARRRIGPTAGAQALRQQAQEQGASGDGTANAPEGPVGAEKAAGDAVTTSPVSRAARCWVIATAVRYAFGELATYAPERLIEVQVPPFGVTQAVVGAVHHRDTPPSVVETDAVTWLALATGRLAWQDTLTDGALHASGERYDLPAYLSLVRLPG